MYTDILHVYYMLDQIYKYSNPTQAQKNAYKYLGKKNGKIYMVLNPNTNIWIHFGQIGYEDYTKHKDKERRKNYLTRAGNIKGNWKNNKYSPNNLSINILW